MCTMNQRTHADESPDTDKTGFHRRDSGKNVFANASAGTIVHVLVVPIIARVKQNNVNSVAFHAQYIELQYRSFLSMIGFWLRPSST